MNITTVIFDIGRVLVTINTHNEKFAKIMRAVDIRPDRAIETYWHKPEVGQHMLGGLDSAGFYAAVRKHCNGELTYEEFEEGWCDLFQPNPGMEALFGELSGRYRLGLLSDTDPLHWRKVRSMLPWLAAVEKPTLSYEVGYLKPHPAMYQAAADNCGSRKEQCLFIDDLRANVDGARYFGMPALLFIDPGKLRRDLSGLGIL